jgi:hypothetical protein
MTKKSPGKPGPEPETLKLEGNWEQAVKKALARGRPSAAKSEPRAPNAGSKRKGGSVKTKKSRRTK